MAYDQRVANDQRAEVIGLLTRALDGDRLDLADYDRRVAAVGTATYVSELSAQVADLAPEFTWHPHAAAPPVTPHPAGNTGRAALVLGLVSLPMSLCLLGWVFGILAFVFSRRAPRGAGPALFGRVFGVVGIVLSVGAGIAVASTLRNHPAG